MYVHGIHSSVDDLDYLVQDDKGGLQAGKLDKRLDGPGISLATALDLLATFAQTGETEVAGAL